MSDQILKQENITVTAAPKHIQGSQLYRQSCETSEGQIQTQ